MPLTLRRGTVSAILERHEGLARIEVDGQACVAFIRLTGPVAIGDDVLVNVQARELGLGSGGFDVLHANLTRGLDLAAVAGAHVTKLPYTPIQLAVRHGEEDGGIAQSLSGMPVVCCSLHSQLAPVCAALQGLRVVYAQLPGGALPVSLSDAVRALKAAALLETAIAVGACFDGDVDCVNTPSALAWAAGHGCEAIVCAVGPGITGTGTELGHGGVAAAEAANAVAALGGSPIVAARVSEGDPRPRHRGVSHHTRAVLGLCLAPVTVAWPAGLDPPAWLDRREDVDVTGWRESCAGLPLEHMGRGVEDDPWFFAAAFAAGRLARSGSGDRAR